MSFTPSRRIGGIKRRLPTTYQGETVLAAISLPPVTAEANRHAPSRPIPAGSRPRRAGRRSQLARTGPPRPGRDRLPARLHRHRRERHPPAPRRGPGTGGPSRGRSHTAPPPVPPPGGPRTRRRPPRRAPSRWSRPHPAARPSVNAGSSARLTPHRAHRSRARRSSSTGPPPGHHAGTRPEHQRPGTRRAVRAREPQVTAGRRIRIDRKRARPYDGHERHRLGSLLAAGAIQAFPGPEDVPPAVPTTGTTPACCPGPAARCVRRRVARRAPFRNKRRAANAGDAEGDA